MAMPADEALQTLAVTLARVESKLDNITAAGADREVRLRILESHDTASHGRRIAALERWRWTVTGAAAAAGAGVGTITTALLGIGHR